MDPTEEEGKVASGSLLLAGLPALGTITSVWQSGSMAPDEAIKVRSLSLVCWMCLTILQCMEACQESCEEIHTVMAQSLLEKAQNT